jgi:hypothetical protein
MMISGLIMRMYEVGRGRGQGIEEVHCSRETGRMDMLTEENGDLNRELCQVRQTRKG